MMKWLIGSIIIIPMMAAAYEEIIRDEHFNPVAYITEEGGFRFVRNRHMNVMYILDSYGVPVSSNFEELIREEDED